MSKVQWLGDLQSCLTACDNQYGAFGGNWNLAKLAECVAACNAPPMPVPKQDQPAPQPAPQPSPAPATEPTPPPPPTPKEPPSTPISPQTCVAGQVLVNGVCVPAPAPEEKPFPWGWVIGGVAVVGIAALALGAGKVGGAMANPQELTEAQRLAVLAYAAEHGRNWKSDLSADWMRAAARVRGEHSGELQQVRNTLGPSWLRRVSLKDLQRGEARPKFKIYLERVPLDRGGYDKRGRYWGVGAPLYRYSDDSGAVDGYVRASSRAEAKDKVRYQSAGMDVSFYRS